MTPSPAPRALLGFGLLLALLAFYRLADLAPFMNDARASEHALGGVERSFEDESFEKPFFERHCCFTCYVIAAQLAEGKARNLYRERHYRREGPETEPPTRAHAEIGDLLNIDRFQYPPPFLLLPWLLERAGGGFFGARTIFFWLELGSFGLCLALLARWLSLAGGSEAIARPGAVSLWALGVAGAVLLPNTTLTSLQIGNVHPFVMCLGVLGMLSAYGGRNALAGALLGFITVSKIFPGLLVLYLLASGRWRASLWSLGFGLLYSLAAWGVFGSEGYRAFFEYQLPRLASGEAFQFAFERARPMLVNGSITGLAHRLELLWDLEGARTVSRWMNAVFGWAIIALTIVLGRRRRGGFAAADGAKVRWEELGLWLALLALAQMRSPFLPAGYGAFVFLWLFGVRLFGPTLEAGGGAGARVAMAVGCLLFALPLPLPVGPETLELDVAAALVATLFGVVAATSVLVGGMRAARARGGPRGMVRGGRG